MSKKKAKDKWQRAKGKSASGGPATFNFAFRLLPFVFFLGCFA
jgi:hypothetical protein